MKVVLKQDVKGLGKKGELVNASDGYARNFLFPKNLAAEANAQNMTELKNREQAAKYKIETETAEAKKNAERISGKTIAITAKAGQRIVEKMPNNKHTPKQIAEELGLIGVVKDDEVQAAARQAIDENPKAVEDYHNGQKASLNFLMGQVMRLTKGKADPGETVKILRELLGE